MTEEFKEVQDLNKSQYTEGPKIALLKAVSKLGEEVGELIMEINKSTGVKHSKPSIVHVKEELADVLQNVLSIADLYTISYQELCKELKKKNKKWKSKLYS